MTLIKTIVFTIFIPGTVTIVFPYYLLPYKFSFIINKISFFQYFGITLILVGTSFYFRCAFDFSFKGKGTPAPIDPPRELVVSGLYRLMRNPMYIGIIFILIGEALLFGAFILFVYVLLIFTIFHLFIILYEEPTLERKFGDSYILYCKRVSHWFPRKFLQKKKQ